MRWFTREWQTGDLDDAEAARRETEYAAYIVAVADRLPERVLVLALPRHRHLSVDDAKLDVLEVDDARRLVRLRLLNGDIQSGYGKLEIECSGAALVTPSVEDLRAIFADEATEFLAQEVELVGDGPEFELRFLLWPRGELAIRCRDLTATWRGILDTTRADRRNEVLMAQAPAWSTGHRIEVSGVGPCWLVGNGHTFPGRMLAESIETGQSLSISSDDIVDPSPAVAAWVEGFLAGQEPPFEEWLGVDALAGEATADDPVLRSRYEAFLRTFRETGRLPYPLNRRPAEPPPADWATRAWTIAAGEVLRWDGSAWSAADPQPAFTFEVLDGSACAAADGHDLQMVDLSRAVCPRCGLLADGLEGADRADETQP